MSDDPMAAILLRLRAERETSLWWSEHPEHVEPTHEAAPTNGPLWDDSEVSTARRRRVLEEASEAMREDVG